MEIIFLLVLVGSLSGLLIILAPLLARRLRRWRDRRRIRPYKGSTVTDRDYPMYVLPLDKLLQLKSFRSHQQLLVEGSLVQATPNLAGRIIFVSSEW